MNRTRGAVLAAVACLTAVAPAAAQQHIFEGIYARPTGEFAEYSGAGGGMGYAFVLPISREEIVSLRAGAGFLAFRPVTDHVCVFSETEGCARDLPITTQRSLFFGTVGPQFAVTFGPAKPYVHAGLGLSMFESSSDVPLAGTDPRQSTFGFDWIGGGGVSVDIWSTYAELISLDLGFRYHGGTRAKYLPRTTAELNPSGGLRHTPSPGQRNVAGFLVGLGFVF